MARLRSSLAVVLAASLSLGLSGCERPAKTVRFPFPEDVRFQGVGTEDLTPASMRGRPWLVNLWMPGCHACVVEFAELNRVHDALAPQGLGVLAVSVTPHAESVRAMAAKHDLRFAMAFTRDELLTPLRLEGVLPSTVFVDAKGDVRVVASGPRDYAFFMSKAQALLKERGGKQTPWVAR
jgi:hypothetical protein